MFLKLNKLFLCLAACLVIFTEFSYAEQADDAQPPIEQKKEEVKPPIDPKKEELKQEIERIRKLVERINEKNQNIKKSPEWLKEAYSSIKIKKLNDIPKADYNSFKQYVTNDEIYIIVHAGFFVFFDNKTTLSSPKDSEEAPSKNIPERLFEKIHPDDFALKVLQEHENLLRYFLELMSTEKKLVILILPKDYKKYLGYGYISGLDEYARYINEMSNMSDTFMYMESQTNDTGFLDKNNLEVLSDFLNDIGVKNIMLGGGYLGKCLDDFYESIRKKYSHDNVFLVPEIISIPPAGMVADTSSLLTKGGKINFKSIRKFAYRYYKLGGIAAEDPNVTPKFKRLPVAIYRAYINKQGTAPLQ